MRALLLVAAASAGCAYSARQREERSAVVDQVIAQERVEEERQAPSVSTVSLRLPAGTRLCPDCAPLPAPAKWRARTRTGEVVRSTSSSTAATATSSTSSQAGSATETTAGPPGWLWLAAAAAAGLGLGVVSERARTRLFGPRAPL